MAEARISVDQNEFMWPVCLDLLKDPVTTSCGHSYCKICITGHWDQEDRKKVYSCPQCRQTFSPRPALARNTMLAEVVEKLKKTKLPADSDAGAGDVKCDVCTERKYKAVKSCLNCQESYCQTHFDHHEEFHSRKPHKVTEATGRLQEMICQKHDKLLEVFCLTDQKCLCVLCIDDHKNHNTISATAQRTENQMQLKELQKQLEESIQQREKDLQQLRETVESHKRSAQTAVEDSEKIFTELIRSIKRSRSELIRLIRDQEKTAVSRAEERLERLEQEINDLRRRDAELEQLSHTFCSCRVALDASDGDHECATCLGHTQAEIVFVETDCSHCDSMSLTFLPLRIIVFHDSGPPQGFQSLSSPPESKHDPIIPFSSLFSFDGVRESVHHLRDKLEDFCKKGLKKISDRGTFTTFIPWTKNDFLQYSHQLTMDLNTVNKRLCLAAGNREITYTDKVQPYPDHPDRFDEYNPQVLCRKSVCGHCYWEIEWSGIVCISVSYKSINRKGQGKECWFGSNDQSWSLICSPSSYSFRHNNKETHIPVKPIIRRIGVFVDHSGGTLSFYSISRNTMSLIHTVQTTFTQPLYPGFGVYHGFSFYTGLTVHSGSTRADYKSSLKLCE
ncbi:tripartite motif-containing protein 16-like [Carassius gibelio]|uniref:tripartite motif-containing protein 16-like n=1 Tax=Carassius gibelio TaxID=101364 RepID=UPI002278BE11|nr:tripartite motif-containing protein 16-like [Carassius gibelio]